MIHATDLYMEIISQLVGMTKGGIGPKFQWNTATRLNAAMLLGGKFVSWIEA